MTLFHEDEERTSGTTAITRRSKPEVLTIGKGRNQRQICSTGRFSKDETTEYVIRNRDRWIKIGELARFCYLANTPSNKLKVRRRMSDLLNHLLVTRRLLLIYEFEGPRIAAVKIFDGVSEIDRQAVQPRIQQMRRRLQWTQQTCELVDSIIRVEAEATTA